MLSLMPQYAQPYAPRYRTPYPRYRPSYRRLSSYSRGYRKRKFGKYSKKTQKRVVSKCSKLIKKTTGVRGYEQVVSSTGKILQRAKMRSGWAQIGITVDNDKQKYQGQAYVRTLKKDAAMKYVRAQVLKGKEIDAFAINPGDEATSKEIAAAMQAALAVRNTST